MMIEIGTKLIVTGFGESMLKFSFGYLADMWKIIRLW